MILVTHILFSLLRTNRRDSKYRLPFLRSPISPASQFALFRSKLGTRDWNWERTEGKARCSGSPTEVDDRSSSSPFSSPLTLYRALPATGFLSLSLSLSLPPFDPSTALLCLFSPYPSPDLSIRLSSPPVLPLYLTPTSHSQLALGEHEYATPRSCR